MDEITLTYGYNTNPPNTIEQILSKPFSRSQTIRLAVFNEHRFAFYFWAKWNQEHNIQATPPSLISFDWHQDLVYPDGHEEQLIKLKTDDLAQVAFYSWARLNPLNDDHILSAAYLNLISDIYVVCKQRESSESFSEVDEFLDYRGNSDYIKKFRTPEELLTSLRNDEVKSLYLDIDLDYFTIRNSSTNSESNFTYVKDEDIVSTFDPQSELMQFLLHRIMGFTIALEPEHTGGFKQSSKYLNLLETLYFESSIGSWNCDWNQHMHNKFNR